MIFRFLIVALIFSANTFAQDDSPLSGRVVHVDDAQPIEAAHVVIEGTDFHWFTETSGAFSFPSLPPGTYNITVTADGYQTFRDRVEVAGAGAPIALVVRLNRELALQESVNVTARVRSYDTDQASVGKAAVPLIDTPASVRVIQRQLIEDRAIADSEEVYRDVAGVTSSPYASIVARGFTQREFVFNGARGNPFGSLEGDVNNSGFSVSQLQLSNIERVEVLRGPASVLYGSSEPGGVINYVTRKPQEVFSARASLRLGQYNQIFGSGEVTGPLGSSDNLFYRVAAFANDRDSFRNNASMRNLQLAGNLLWKVNDLASVGFEYEYIDQDLSGHRLRGVPVNSQGDFLTDIEWTATEPTDFTNLKAHVFQTRFDQRFANDWALDATVRFLQYDREQEYHEPQRVNPDNTMQRAFRDQTRTNDDVSFVVNVNKPVALGTTTNRVLFGAELFRQDHSFRRAQARQSGSGGPVPDLSIDNPVYGQTQGSFYGLTDADFSTDTALARQFGLYAQDHIEVNEKLHVVFGGRWDNFNDTGMSGGNPLDGDDNGLTGRAGVVVKPQENWSLYGSYANSFNRPSVLAQTPDANGPFEPETARQLEIGAKTDIRPDLSVTAAYFTITKENMLRPDPEFGPSGNNFNAALQVGEARNRGFEVELLGALTPKWEISANYTYLDSEILDDPSSSFVGQPLPNTAPHSFGLFTRYDILRDTAAGFGLTFVDDRQEPFAGIQAPSYTVVDLHFYQRLGNIADLQLKLENAFDTVYATSSLFAARAGNFPGQPRTFSVIINFDLFRGGP